VGRLPRRRHFETPPERVAARGQRLDGRVLSGARRRAEGEPETLLAESLRGVDRRHFVEPARQEEGRVLRDAVDAADDRDLVAARARRAQLVPQLVGDEVFEGVDLDPGRSLRVRLRALV
jgi:hypothetical protein